MPRSRKRPQRYAEQGFTAQDAAVRAEVPLAVAQVAFGFLKDRGLLETVSGGRRQVAATSEIVDEATAQYEALRQRELASEAPPRTPID